MIRPILFGLLCCLTLFACKNDAASETKVNPTTTTTATTKSEAKSSSGLPKSFSTDITPLESSVRNTICGVMINTVVLKDGILNIEYFKNADEYKALIKNDKMNEQLFKKYWSNSSRTKKVMALVPSKILSEHEQVENVNITIHTGDKALSANINRDKLALFVGESWKEIQTDWNNRYRFVVVNNKEKRKAFFDQFVTAK